MKAQTPSSVSNAPVASAYICCTVVCPMCGLSGSQYRLNPRQYWHTSREVDLQPSGYRCRGVAESVHPPLLAMWHCTGCFFTAQAADFQDPLKGVLIRTDTVASSLKERARTDAGFRRLIETLRADVRLDEINFYQAIKLHLLAYWIWDEIGRMVKQDYLTQASYVLQLAWLYRDLQTVDPARAQTVARLEQLFVDVRRDWPEVPATEEASLRKALSYYEDSLSISTFSKDAMNEVTALHRIGRIQMQLKEYRPARETFRRSTIRAQVASAEIRQQLGIRGNMPGREEVTGAAREALVDRERKLSTIMNDESRLTDTILDALGPARKK